MLIKKKVCYLDNKELQVKINDLSVYYLPMNMNTAFHSNKLIALKNLEYILEHADRKSVQDSDFTPLLVCALTLVYYFGMRLKSKLQKSRFAYKRKKKFFHAEACFQKTMSCLQPEYSTIIIKITLKFIDEISLWPYESFVGQILIVLLHFNPEKIMMFNFMLTDIHCVLFSNVKSARHCMRILYELLKTDIWVSEKQELLPFITRLLNFFVKCERVSAYGHLRKGYDVCLRRIFEMVENQQRLTIIDNMLNCISWMTNNDDTLMEITSLLERVAELYEVRSYDSITEGLINRLLKDLLSSPHRQHSLIGSRILQRLLDRQGNLYHLSKPVIFYELSQTNLVLGVNNSADQRFLKSHWQDLYVHILKAVSLHGHNIDNLEAIFKIICFIVLEVPCVLTAALISCIAMNIQDMALNADNLSSTCRCWLHATVVSVMSLICLVHRSSVLYSYVNQIISRRTREAPQLNPPLMQAYSSDLTWNKPTLFFEDWTLRNSLSKHFSIVSSAKKHNKAEK